MAPRRHAAGVVRQLARDLLAQVASAPPAVGAAPWSTVAALVSFLGASASFAARRTVTAAATGGGAACWLSIVLSLTVLRGGYVWDAGGFRRCVATQPLPLSPDGVINLLLLAPAATLGLLAVGRAVRVIACLVVVSIVVEAAQAMTSVGVCDTSDVVLNASGAALAVGTTLVVRAALARRAPTHVPGSQPCRRSS